MTSLEPTVADRREAMAVLSEICPWTHWPKGGNAVVTRDNVPGLKKYNNCLKDSTLLCRNWWRGTALQAAAPPYFPEGCAPGYERSA